MCTMFEHTCIQNMHTKLISLRLTALLPQMVHIVAQCLELFLEVLLARAEHVETLVPLRVLQLFAVFPYTVHLNRPVGNLLCVEGKRRHL